MSTAYSERATKLPLDVYRAEVKWRRECKHRTGAEWRAIVDTINGKRIRIQVACIVWWDWLADRYAWERAAELDDLVAAWDEHHEADRMKVREALVAIGYPPRIAEKRTEENVWRALSAAEARRLA